MLLQVLWVDVCKINGGVFNSNKKIKKKRFTVMCVNTFVKCTNNTAYLSLTPVV